MIVFPDKQILILTPPHTASGFLHRFYCSQGAYFLVGPNSEDIVSHHYMRPHNAYDHFKKVLVVRRPFERYVGLFEHYNWWGQHTKSYEPVSFEFFVKEAILKDSPEFPIFYRQTIQEALDEAKTKPDIIWRYEDLNKPPVDITAPEFNPPKRDYSQYEWARYMIEQIGKEDTKLYENVS
jgi:hypothetical protein